MYYYINKTNYKFLDIPCLPKMGKKNINRVINIIKNNIN